VSLLSVRIFKNGKNLWYRSAPHLRLHAKTLGQSWIKRACCRGALQLTAFTAAASTSHLQMRSGITAADEVSSFFLSFFLSLLSFHLFSPGLRPRSWSPESMRVVDLSRIRRS
jgi:hypothetical protein